ncbi:uncharacterized protein LOC132249203 isoform X3 [Alligator mississippiensis]|uniref:uncharacterized protein LOC132249203 isoform X3 n=1 Tax=Alligator mississippiensis TaxID=8496 RepID=UPI00287737DD|nr:uncharacterized protein LOC132249203 isoform X3 [Alligator mississippiensis]
MSREAIGWSGRLGAVTTTPPFFALIGLWRGGGTRNLTSYLHSDWLPGTGGGGVRASVCRLVRLRPSAAPLRCPRAPHGSAVPGAHVPLLARTPGGPRELRPAVVATTCGSARRGAGCSSCPRPWSRRVSEGPQPQRIGPWGRRTPRSCHVCKGRSRDSDGCAGPAALPRQQPRRHGRQDEMALSLGYAASMETTVHGDSVVSGTYEQMQNSAEASQFLEASFSGQRSSQELDETTRSDISERLSVEDVESETGALETTNLKAHKALESQ